MPSHTYNPPFQPVASRIVPDLGDPTLVGSWLHQGCRGPRFDASPGGNDLALSGTGSNSFGKDKSFVGDGTTAYLSKAAVNLGALTALTIESWVCPANIGAADETIFTWATAAGTRNLTLYIDSTRIAGVLFGAFEHAETVALVSGEFIHVIWTYDRTDSRIYLNGALVDSEDHANAIPSTARDLEIGCRYTTGASLFFDGVISSVNVHSEAKPLTWVQRRFKAGVPR